MSPECHTFGPFVLDPARGKLLRNHEPVTLGQRALAVLAALADARDQVVSKDALIARAWPGVVVEDGNLTVQIAALRRALGQTPDGQSWILTVPRRGYRLLTGEGAARGDGAEPVPPRLAVLPFQTLAGVPEQDYFAEGVVEDILAALSRFRSFAVIAHDASFAFSSGTGDARHVAEELGVDSCWRAACAAPAIGCASPRISSTAAAGRRSGPSVSTARSRTSSRCRTGSPRMW